MPKQMFVMTWNPRKGSMEPPYESRLADIASGGVVEDLWSTGIRKRGIEVGDDVLLFRQKDDRGIVASGHAKGEVHLADDGDHRVQVVWEEWVALEDRLPIDILREIAPKFFGPRVRASGRKVDDDEAILLKNAWNGWLQDRSLLSGEEAGARPLSKGDQVPEGAKTRVLVNRYERDPVARRRCLEHFGYQCQVCGLSFEDRYGEIGCGFMHVHHKTPLSAITDREDHLVDPTRDLVPVCPNCHAMLHRPKGKVLTVIELQRHMKAVER